MRGSRAYRRQQPGGDTPGVAAAPVALPGVIVPGGATYIVILSAHPDVFGVGTTPVAGSMLVSPSWATSCWIVPSGGLAGTSGVESGKAAPLVGGPPGVELHTTFEGLPSGATGDMVPVVLPLIDVELIVDGPNDIAVVALVLAVDATVVPSATMVPGVVTMVPGGSIVPCGRITTVPCGRAVPSGTRIPGVPNADWLLAPLDVGLAVTGPDEVICVGDAKVVCADTGEQLMLVPGAVGSSASGTGANVVSGAAGWVVDENGLGPKRGDETIAPGVDGRPMAVVPMVETCARLA